MKVAVASSGLGHVARGIESWAADTARALAEQGVDVTLFCGGEKIANSEEETYPATACRSIPAPPRHRTIAVGSLRRDSKKARLLVRLMPGFAWRWGLKSSYGWEQWTFWRRLWPRLRAEGFTILHVQDPRVAWWCRRFRRAGRVRTREILAHATEEPPEFVACFEHLQHLAPWHQEQFLTACATRGIRARSPGKVIPNFVDTQRFHPDPDTRCRVRARLGLSSDAFVAIGVGSLKREHKRVDWLIREWAAFLRSQPADAYLLLVGASTPDAPVLTAEAQQAAGAHIRVLPDQPRRAMPDLFTAADVFVHAALFEMMPLAFLEAAACGLPLITHGHPVMRWMTGPEGVAVDMTRPGALADTLARLAASPETRAALGRAARTHMERHFAKSVVVPQYVALYQEVTDAP